MYTRIIISTKLIINAIKFPDLKFLSVCAILNFFLLMTRQVKKVTNGLNWNRWGN